MKLRTMPLIHDPPRIPNPPSRTSCNIGESSDQRPTSPFLMSLSDSLPSLDTSTREEFGTKRRKSVFGRRSRSNTVSPTMSSHDSGASMASMDNLSSRRISPDSFSSMRPSSSWTNERQPDQAKSFFARSGKKIKRHTSKLSLSSISPASEDVEESIGWRTHQEGVWKRRRDNDRRASKRRGDYGWPSWIITSNGLLIVINRGGSKTKHFRTFQLSARHSHFSKAIPRTGQDYS